MHQTAKENFQVLFVYFVYFLATPPSVQLTKIKEQ